jgi:hypothetical protein
VTLVIELMKLKLYLHIGSLFGFVAVMHCEVSFNVLTVPGGGSVHAVCDLDGAGGEAGTALQS